MNPAISDNIPIYIRNTFEPEHPGTRIFTSPPKGELVREKCVCGFSTVDNISLLNIEGSGMIGVPGIAHRLFGALKSASISVMFIAQASSEHSICCAFKDSFAAAAKKAVEEAFFFELKNGIISKISQISDCSIIAAVGESMSNMPGVSGLFFGALGNAKINVLSTAQGCDERNISAVVYGRDASRALRAVHAAFWLSYLEISVAIVGTGRVGSAVLQSLLDQLSVLNERFGLNIKIRGIANSSRMILGNNLEHELKGKLHTFFSNSSSPIQGSPTKSVGLKRTRSNVSLSDVERTMAESGNGRVPTDLDGLFTHLIAGDTPHAIIIDCTNSTHVGSLHPTWIKKGANIVTASKLGISSDFAVYKSIKDAVVSSNRMYMSEVTIGASLPICTTLHDILFSGDAVHSIVGLMSVSVGTVITEICENKLSFSQALEKTYKTGLFEDDVFVDLSGREAAQKLLILARELGFEVELRDIEIEHLAARRKVASWSDVGTLFAAEDATLAARAESAAAKNCTLRYVQRIDCSPPVELGQPVTQRGKPKMSVRLEEVPLQSSYALVKGAVYYFAFHTERYSQHPLVVQVIVTSHC